jgi:3-dehydroquinate dehydratase type I
MTELRIAATLVDDNLDVIKIIEPDIDFWEIRLDLIGAGWYAVAKEIKKPWIACNRSPLEGGKGQTDESTRIKELLKGLEAGAAIVDIELSSPMLSAIVPLIKKRAECLISYHNYVDTPGLSDLSEIVHKQKKAGADICKVVTTARGMEDNLTLLKLIKQNPEVRIVCLAMGAEGRFSRILSPLAGAYFTFASLEAGKESAAGQIPAREMREIYELIRQK